jgi:hypothetical protein
MIHWDKIAFHWATPPKISQLPPRDSETQSLEEKPVEPSVQPTKKTTWLVHNAENCNRVLNETIDQDKINLKEKLKTSKTAGDLVSHPAIETVDLNDRIAEIKETSEQVISDEEADMAKAEEILDPFLNTISDLGKIPLFFAKENELAEKTKSLQELEEQLKNPELSEEKIETIKFQILTLKKQMKKLEDSIQADLLKNMTTAFKTTITATKTATGQAANFSGAAVHALHIAGPSLGIAGGVIGTVTSGIGLKNDLKTDDVVSDKFDELMKLLKATKPGSLLHKIIFIKLQQLEQQSNDLGFSLVKNYVGVLSSTLGVSASIGNIVAAAGVVLSVKLAALVSATGIGALVLGIPVLIGGTAYLIHRNKEAIAHGLDTTGKVLEVEWEKFQKEKIDEKLKEIKQMENFLTEGSDRKKNIKDYYLNTIAALAQEKIKLHEQLFYMEEDHESIFGRITTHITKMGIKSKIEEVNNKMKEVVAQVRLINEEEEKMVQLVKHKISSENKDAMLAESSALKERIKILETEKANLEKQGEYITMASNVKGMNWQEIQAMEESLQIEIKQLLEQDANALEPIRVFLTEQNFRWEVENFHENPAFALLKYMTNKETA